MILHTESQLGKNNREIFEKIAKKIAKCRKMLIFLQNIERTDHDLPSLSSIYQIFFYRFFEKIGRVLTSLTVYDGPNSFLL